MMASSSGAGPKILADEASRPRTATARSSGLKSMTGYAQTRIVENGWSLRVAVRSVNHRFLDLHLRVPEGFEPVEPRIRQIVRERVRRGHLDVTVHYELAGPAAVGVNREVAAAYLEAVNQLRRDFEIEPQPDLAAILRLPGVIGLAAASLEDKIAELEVAVTKCLVESLDKLDRMRADEANALRVEMSERLAQEAAIAAERSDVSEEITRLRSHVQQFEALVADAGDIGKKLDFLLQEMQREANTLLSKTPGNEAEGLEITRLALEIKSEIEKLREQVQNIE
jgi:uncharacterized protein YicC (UPF0701 family)